MDTKNGKNGETFIRVTNKQVWKKLNDMETKLDQLQLGFDNHLSHHKKFEKNLKWIVPFVLTAIFFIVEALLLSI